MTAKKRVPRSPHGRALHTALQLVTPFLEASECPPFGFGNDDDFYRCIDRVASEHFQARQRDREFSTALKRRLPKFDEHDDLQTLANDRVTPIAKAAYVFGLAVGIRLAALRKEDR